MSMWIENQTVKKIRNNLSHSQREEPSTHKDLKQKLLLMVPLALVAPTLVVSNMLQFPKPSIFRQSKSTNEKATNISSGDTEVQVIDKEGYIWNFIYIYIYLTGIYYEHMLQGTYASKTEKCDPGLIAVKDFYNFFITLYNKRL